MKTEINIFVNMDKTNNGTSTLVHLIRLDGNYSIKKCTQLNIGQKMYIIKIRTEICVLLLLSIFIYLAFSFILSSVRCQLVINIKSKKIIYKK